MGFDHATVHFLSQSKRLGISLDKFVMLGRQTFYLTPLQLHATLQSNGYPCSLDQAEQLHRQDSGYCESFLRYIGATTIDSIDVSSYEQASILHDMNQPMPEQWNEQFSLLLDGGSLEHVFNYPVALSNCLNAVRVGGHLVTITPANNLLGHGFYQISPELLFRVLSPENGYRLEHMLLYETPWNGTWYEIGDPAKLHTRVELTNRRPSYVIACAKRVEIVPLFRSTPQQSDYSRIWRESSGELVAQPQQSGWKQAMPAWVGNLYRRLHPLRPPYFQKVPAKLSGPRSEKE